METKVAKIKSGGNLLVYTNKNVNGVFVTLRFDAGSVNEPKNKKGLAHFCEHAIFSFPTTKYKTRSQKKSYIDTLNFINGSTDYFKVNFYAKCPKYKIEKTFEFLTHSFSNLIITNEEIEKEKQIIKSEFVNKLNLNSVENSRLINTEILSFKNSKNITTPVIGKLEDLMTFTVKDVQNYIEQYFNLKNLNIVFSGNISLREAKKLVDKYIYTNIKKDGKRGITNKDISRKKPSKIIYSKSQQQQKSLISISFPIESFSKSFTFKDFINIKFLQKFYASCLSNIIRTKYSLCYSFDMYYYSYGKIHMMEFVIYCLNENVNKILEKLPEVTQAFKKGLTKKNVETNKQKSIDSINLDNLSLNLIQYDMVKFYENLKLLYGDKLIKAEINLTKKINLQSLNSLVDEITNTDPYIIIISEDKPEIEYKKYIKLLKQAK